MSYHVNRLNITSPNLESIRSEGSHEGNNVNSVHSSHSGNYSNEFSPQLSEPVNYSIEQTVTSSPSDYRSLPSNRIDMSVPQGLERFMSQGSFVGEASSTSHPILNEATGNMSAAAFTPHA